MMSHTIKLPSKPTEPNKKAIIGITGSIAAYKALELVRQLKKQGYNTWVVMTENAKKFIAPLSFETLSNNPVFCQMFYENETVPVHIDLTRDASIIIIAPATANIIAKAAAGIADDLLSTIILAADVPVIFVPAMNHRMWQADVTQKNIGYLKSAGCKFVEPESGELACAEIGKGRFPSIDTILKEISAVLNKREILKGKKIVITAGRTEEPLDPIRVFTNRSSGRMGVEIAKAAATLGADVTLISANLSVPLPEDVKIKQVGSSREMLDAVAGELPGADVLIMAAAVSDYKPEKRFNHKTKDKQITLKLTRTEDILKALTLKKHRAYLVGFSLDTHNNISEAKRKLKEKRLNLIISNPADTLNSDMIKPTIIFNRNHNTLSPDVKVERMARQTKKAFAEKLTGIIARELKL